MIDKNTGNIILNDSLVLKPNTSFQFIEQQNLGEVQKFNDIGNGYKWLNVKNIKLNNEYFIISFCFKDEMLSSLSICVDDKPFILETSWDSWSRKNEEENLKKYKIWLEKELGKERTFKWGEVWASYDPKGGSSSIGIRYY